jgi:hypothetical protein
MNAASTLAETLVRSWVAVYTRGLPASLRRERIDEIVSDLWEHQRAAEVVANARSTTAVHVLLRLVVGVPSDIVWRLEAGVGGRTRREQGMKASPSLSLSSYTNAGWAEKIFLACLALLAIYQAATVVFGAGYGLGLWGGGADDPGNGWYLLLPLNFAGLVLLLAGLLRRESAPFLAGVLLAVGVLPSILMFWMMLPPVVALGVAVYALLHGWTEQKRMETRA